MSASAITINVPYSFSLKSGAGYSYSGYVSSSGSTKSAFINQKFAPSCATRYIITGSYSSDSVGSVISTREGAIYGVVARNIYKNKHTYTYEFLGGRNSDYSITYGATGEWNPHSFYTDVYPYCN